ncbi:MAG TPA: S1C family serine protease [Egibacteraceae bacterium]|nr:S1C family serine protease [Egibacteraceae bacterium]
MSAIADLEQSARTAVERMGDAVVGIGARGPAGSGIVIGPEQVLTNAHNLRAERIRVSFPGGRTEEGEVAGVDLDGDLGVITVPTGQAAGPEWAADGAIAIGKPVFALANPGGRGLRITFGLVSATGRSFRGPLGRRIAGSFEHTAPLARGSSGGPVVDADGRLVGLSTHRLADGFYLAVPADAALRQRVEALSRGESPSRPRLGIGLAPSGVAPRLRRAVGLPERDGVLVRLVEEDSPAERAGLRSGDLIVEADGREITGVDALYEALDAAAADGSLRLAVLRGVEELTVVASLGGEPAAQP